ncbi:hypothetical protein CMI47_19455 [Candidatus Pacearchaeota archaeon]|nr:hypothetical protein [Candidatus Pacearchaeota archaeon]|tara:strand:+ start:4429 stop:4761 length:333 start_codon:yes stop_codon:yes gene_type:complete
MYEYNAKLIRIVDGDTLDAMIDIGFDVWVKKRIRLAGINAPESRTRDLEEKKLGLKAKSRLAEVLDEANNEFRIISHGVGKYGRCLGEIFIGDVSVNSQLLEEGIVRKYK